MSLDNQEKGEGRENEQRIHVYFDLFRDTGIVNAARGAHLFPNNLNLNTVIIKPTSFAPDVTNHLN